MNRISNVFSRCFEEAYLIMQAHKLTSSQAHKLTSSQAISSRLPIVASVSLGLLVGFLASECQENATANSVTASAAYDHQSFDAGVIFASESSYLCIPFERLGLNSSDQVAAIKTSCECVRGSAVSYLAPNKTVARALRFKFVPESRSDKSLSVVASLSVRVTIEMKGIGNHREFSINLIHSALHNAEANEIVQEFVK